MRWFKPLCYNPDCANIHCEVREGVETDPEDEEEAGQEVVDGEVTFTQPPLVQFRTRHCVHQQSQLTCPKLGQAARRICRYYSQSGCVVCLG